MLAPTEMEFNELYARTASEAIRTRVRAQALGEELDIEMVYLTASSRRSLNA
jgi:hypothetical protein